ncbi:adenylate/guanylate cyclase domain-containing protein [Candidatus Peregrinibacteria bacterium]|nr:adenylate/guanylate cyclase domain-containing protein [Candidatus Peregrinibacteria bacterium]
MLKKILKYIGLGAALLLLVFLVMQRGWFMGIQHSLQNKFYDYDSASSEIVIVAIDEKSLKPENLGPFKSWPRMNYAKAIDVLNANNAAAIGIDVTFPDHSILGRDDDQTLADALSQYDNVILASRYYFDGEKKGYEWPNETILKGHPVPGWINIQLDPDGFVRSLPLFAESDKGVIDAFSLALARIYLRAEPSDYRVVNNYFDYSETIQIPSWTEKDKESGEEVHFMYINYFAQPNKFTHISFFDLLNGNLVDKKGNPIDFRDKIVIIGPTAIDLQDDYLSPVSEGVRMPGVEIHANNVQTVITQQFLRDQSKLSLWLTILGILAVNIALFSLLKVRYTIPLVLVEVFGMLVAGIVAYESRILVNVVYPILTILLSFIGTYLLRFIMEQSQRQFIEGAFGHYVNKDVVRQIKKDPHMLELGGAKREITIFFSDIAGFTTISEKLKPEELVKFLNEYLGEMTTIIITNQGTLDKYEGDAIMAFWNVPIPQHDHPLHACKAALENQKHLAKLREKWAKTGLPEIHIRIGLNTGEAVVGNMGSENRFDYTAMGDNVNLASRLESINKQYGTRILISESTYEAVRDHMICREIDQIRVKGKHEPVKIYELICKKEDQTNEINGRLHKYAEALMLYRSKRFADAQTHFELLRGDGPSDLMILRCAEFMKNPPAEDWDGVWNFEVK